MSDLHATLTPNHVMPGQTLTVQFDSEADEFKNARGVVVRIFEVDDASPLEPQPGRGVLIVEFEGELKDNEFVSTKPPKVPKVPGTPDKIKIRVEPSTEVEVPLPNADKEQGVFELRLQVSISKPKRSTFDAKTTVFVRAFDHFQSQGVKRPVIAFITGASSDVFFKAAQGFWRRNADAMMVQPDLSIKEILDVLDAEGEKFGPWGRIIIVAHGDRLSVQLKIFPDSPKTLHEGTIDEELDRASRQSDQSAFTIPSPSSIDSDTEVVFGACNFGRSGALLQRIKDEFFGSAKFVKAPKWLQGYFSSPSHAHEFFVEELLFDRPTRAEAEQDETTEIGRQFDIEKLQSPGLSKDADPAVELPHFVREFRTPSPNTFRFTLSEKDVTDSTGKELSVPELVADFKDRWDKPPRNLHQSPSTFRTLPDRWTISGTKSTLTNADRFISAPDLEQLRGVWFESKDGSPLFQHLIGGVRSLGSRAGDDDVWQIAAAGVDDLHCHVSLNQQTGDGADDLDRVEVEHATDKDGAVTVVGKTTLSNSGDKTVVRLPTRIFIGEASNSNKARIEIRRGKVFRLVFETRRTFLTRRRDMRTFDAKTEYPKRVLVKPDLTDSLHYGTAR